MTILFFFSFSLNSYKSSLFFSILFFSFELVAIKIIDVIWWMKELE